MVSSPLFFVYTMSCPTGKVHASRRRPSRAGRLLAVSWATLLVSRYASASERRNLTTISSDIISRLAFGSCNKQYLPQPVWSAAEELSPDLWLWIGDAVYVDKKSDGGVEKMKEAMALQLENKDYQRFLSKVPYIDGVWDDHDYGVNDAGKELVDHPGRVEAFLDFLGTGPDDPRRGGGNLYSARDFGEAPRKVKVLMLDLRSSRDKYHLFNMSGKKFKFAAMLGAMLRWVSSSLCLGSDYDGNVIGDDQLRWLEEQLTNSDAAVHVLVSTLQMLTSNPLVESWGHFPKSRDKVLSLLRRTNPKGLVILSGDVHHAELASGWKQSTYQNHRNRPDNVPKSPRDNGDHHPAAEESGDTDRDAAGRYFDGADGVVMPPGHEEMLRMSREAGEAGEGASVTSGCPFARKESGAGTVGDRAGAAGGSTDDTSCATALADGGRKEGRGVVEVTTSGMTHSCLSSHGKRMCDAYLQGWREHRWQDDAYYLESNFGDIDIEWADEEGAAQPKKMTITVRDSKGQPVLPAVEYFGDENEHRTAAREATAQLEAEQVKTTSSDEPTDAVDRRTLPRTFLERSPPPECVQPVLPAGCTMRRLSVVAINLVVLVVSCAFLCRRPRRRRRLQTTPTAAATRQANSNSGGSGVGNGPGKDFADAQHRRS